MYFVIWRRLYCQKYHMTQLDKSQSFPDYDNSIFNSVPCAHFSWCCGRWTKTRNGNILTMMGTILILLETSNLKWNSTLKIFKNKHVIKLAFPSLISHVFLYTRRLKKWNGGQKKITELSLPLNAFNLIIPIPWQDKKMCQFGFDRNRKQRYYM